MAASPISKVLDHIRRIALRQEAARLTDGQLLERFIKRRDDAAFDAIARRHGPMVMGVCQRILRNRHDAEDAFQATFLVLVRKAASIASRRLLGNWLYGVAYNTALKARAANARRRRRETAVTEMPEPQTAQESMWNDVLPLLDEELSKLPEKYRAPIVLCDLEGKTGREAARQLGWPEGTVFGRLSRARALLAKRLTQRGVAQPGGMLAAFASENVLSGSVRAGLVNSTIKCAMLAAAGHGLSSGIVSGNVAALTEGVLKAMLLSKLKTVSACALVAAIIGVGAVQLPYRLVAAGQAAASEPLAQPNGEASLPELPQTAAEAKSDLEIQLVEKLLVARRDYQRSLELLRAHYVKQGDREKAKWAEDELRDYHRINHQAFRLDLDVPPPTLRASTNIEQANQLISRAKEYKDKGTGMDYVDNQRRAELLLQQLLKQHPTSNKIGQAAYMLGDLYESRAFKQYRRAALYFERVSQWDPAMESDAKSRADRLNALVIPELPSVEGELPNIKKNADYQAAAVQFRSDYHEVRQEAEKKGLPIAIYATIENSPWTLRLERETFSDPNVAKMLNERFVPLKVHAKQDPRMIEALRIRAFPTVILASPQGKILKTLEGYEPADSFGDSLQDVVRLLFEKEGKKERNY
jgi:RNA polymerase sigma factor (sigma-70 family)